MAFSIRREYFKVSYIYDYLSTYFFYICILSLNLKLAFHFLIGKVLRCMSDYDFV